MKKFNAIAPVLVIMAVLIFGTTANAGILVGDATGSESQSCRTNDEKIGWGILIKDLVGILVTDLGGILIKDLNTSTQTNCGILIKD